jgi:hypothetical protein
MSELYPPIEIELDRPRWIVENLYAQMEFERVTGRNIREHRPGSALDLVARLYGLLKAGARAKETDMMLTPEDVGALVDGSNLEAIWDQMQVALLAGQDEPDESNESDEAEAVPFTSDGQLDLPAPESI